MHHTKIEAMSHRELVLFLLKIDKGYTPTEAECTALANITELQVRGIAGTCRIPASVELLQNLKTLYIYAAFGISSTITNLEALTRLKKLECLHLISFNIDDLTVFGKFPKLKRLFLPLTSLNSLAGLESLSRLEVLHLPDCKGSSLDGLRSLKNLQSLRIERSDLLDLKVLSSLSRLQELELTVGFLESERDLFVLDSLPSLRSLTLPRINFENLEFLRSLKSLRSLDLSRTGISCLHGLEELVDLQTLDLSGTNVETLINLAPLVNLRSLDVAGTDIHSLNGLEYLAKLQTLDLSSTVVDSLVDLRNLSDLQVLQLSSTDVSSLYGLEAEETLHTLVVAATGIDTLDELCRFRGLKRLDLSSTEISSLDGLEYLDKLQELELSNTHIRDLRALTCLPTLNSLSLAGTDIQSAAPLSALTNLQSLNLNRTPITSLTGMEELTKLETLKLSYTCVQDLSPLSALRRLKVLDLSNTKVCELEPLANAANLQALYLSGSNITELPHWIGDLHNLDRLDLTDLSLRELPKELLSLHLPYAVNSPYFFTDGILLRDTTLATQPISLFEQPRDFIQAYYDAEQIPVNEAKVIFLGDGGVGKSYTIERIRNQGKLGEYNTETTPGISITNYQVADEQRNFAIHFWDFGGQEIMHAMHRCFLTNRTCYVVVLTNRWDLMGQARYWLKNIDSFAKGAPVILAVNLWDNIKEWPIDTVRLHNDFKNLVHVIPYSAKNSTDAEFQKLTDAIIQQAELLDSCSMSFPAHWAAIRMELLNEAEQQPYIDKEKYHQICAENGLDSDQIRTWLLEWFNDLGVCFSYHQDAKDKSELAAYKVLNPAWLTNAIYIIINSGVKMAHNGILNKEMILYLLQHPAASVLPNVSYTAAERDYVLEVMRKFTLSYAISDTEEFIPALCDCETPKQLHPTSYQKHISYELRYSYLPDSVVHQMMIRCYRNLNPNKLWRKGLRIDIDVVGLSAVIDMGGSDSILRIDVYANSDVPPWKLLQNLRKDIIEINQELNLNAKDYIVVHRNGRTASFPVIKVLSAKEQGRTFLPSYDDEEDLEDYLVDEILGITFGTETVEAAVRQANRGDGKLADFINTINLYHFTEPHNNTSIEQLLLLLIQNQTEANRKLIDCLIEGFQTASSDPSIQELGNAMAQEQKKKGNPLSHLKKFIGDAADTASKLKVLAQVLAPVASKLMEYAPQVLEAIENGLTPIP